jgi:hypothetical protein
MAGQNYTWQVSTPNIGTGKGVISSSYNSNGKSPFTTITTSNPDGWVKVNPLSNDPTVSKTDYKVNENGLIEYRYTGPQGGISEYSSIQDLIDDVRVSSSVGYQIRSAVQSTLVSEARQKNIGQAPIASLPSTAAVPGTGPAGNTVLPQVPDAPKEISDPGLASTGGRSVPFEDYYYPEELKNNGQDVIRFTAINYGGRKLTVKGSTQSSFGSPGLGDRNLQELKGSVTLPIQPSITDQNSVQWGGEDLNPLQAFGAAVSYNAQTDISGAAQQTMSAVEGLAKQLDGNLGNAMKIYLAGKAVGVNGLLSRIGGGVVNPNLELLFQGPQLRPFNFSFRLSPRSPKEAEQVKGIIRFFKENMVVQNTDADLFLKAPNVFKIRYLIRGDVSKDHPSLNRIKICALQSCSVDYTPDGSYMTFNDSNATMTSYNLTLQFQELEPITAKDYTTKNPLYTQINLNEIGY